MTTEHIHITTDGDTHWVECFAAHPDAEHGEPIHPISPGDRWDDVAAKVSAHNCEDHQ